MPEDKPLTYKDAGVDIDAGNALVERIKPLVGRTHGSAVLGGIGGFGGLFQPDFSGYANPVLVAGTDGVGTKLKLAIALHQYDTIGIDLVAMCVNDILVLGAEPLFFLDYYATARLEVDVAESVVGGIAAGCIEAGAALIGGETAELPGLYQGSDFDLAGFCVGIVERDRIIDGSGIRPGDHVLGLASSGPHSNGYSLINRVLELQAATGERQQELLSPTRIYVKPVLELLRRYTVRGLAHITGGGLAENLARVLPDTVDARIHEGSWRRPEIFDWLQENGNIPAAEMRRTFNCGIGLVLVVAADDAGPVADHLSATGETVYSIGSVEPGCGRVRLD